jgi:hypothetical protein
MGRIVTTVGNAIGTGEMSVEIWAKYAPAGAGRAGAGDRDRTDDIQLGKLTFYH